MYPSAPATILAGGGCWGEQALYSNGPGRGGGSARGTPTGPSPRAASFPAKLPGPLLPTPNHSRRRQTQLQRSEAPRRKCGAHGVTQSQNSPSQPPRHRSASSLPSPACNSARALLSAPCAAAGLQGTLTAVRGSDGSEQTQPRGLALLNPGLAGKTSMQQGPLRPLPTLSQLPALGC